jgi:hypothetical protein
VERRRAAFVPDFWITQALTGHGCFGAYLHSIQRRQSYCLSMRLHGGECQTPSWTVQRCTGEVDLWARSLALPQNMPTTWGLDGAVPVAERESSLWDRNQPDGEPERRCIPASSQI